MATMQAAASPKMIAISHTNNIRLLNEIVEAFETTRSRNADTQIDSFLPEHGHPDYARIAIELMRVDLEHSWRDGSPKSLEDYKNCFTDVLSDNANLRQLAFEDYRQRLLNGESIHRETYRQLGVDTNDWPDVTEQDDREYDNAGFGTVAQLTGELDRLVESIQEFPVEGQIFGPYEVVSQIGQGAFARVYLARERELADRLVVLKVGSLTSTEHERLARLQHTNIVPIYSVHSIDAVSVICMPFFGLSTLSNVLHYLECAESRPTSADVIPTALANKRTAAPEYTTRPVGGPSFSTESYEAACVSIMRRVAEALAHAHDRGIVHRDLKPANILLSDDGQPMLLDFNVSDDVVPGGATCLSVGGTLPYMSPEQLRSVRSGASIDERSDIYSFGIVFYELLTGIHPFPIRRTGAASTVRPSKGHETHRHHRADKQHHRSIVEYVERVLAERESTPPDIRQQNQRIPVGLANIIAKCLQPDPADRYATAVQLCEDLVRHEQHLPLRHTKRAPVGERCAKWCRRHPRLTSATTVTAMALAIVLSLSMFAFVKVREVGERNAMLAANRIHQKLPDLRALLTSPSLSSESLAEGRALAHELLQMAGLRDATKRSADIPLHESVYLNRLSDAAQETFRDDIGELYYLLAHSARRDGTGAVDGESTFQTATELNRLSVAAFGDNVPATVTRQRMRITNRPVGFDVVTQTDHDANRLASLRSDRSDMLLAIDNLLTGHASNAITILEDAARREPLSFSHRFVLANAYVAAGRMNDGEDSYTVCVSMDPDSFLSVFTRGQCRLDMGLHSEAEFDFTAALEIRPQSVEALVNRAVARKQTGQYRLAEADLSSALELEPAWPRVYFLRSRVRELLGDTAGAIADVKDGLGVPPQSEMDWLARGIALLKSDPNAAYKCFEEALQLNPLSRSALRNMAHVVSEHRRDTDAAMEMLDRIVEISPGYVDDVVSRAVLNARSGNWNDATSEIERVLKIRRNGKTVFQAACVYSLLAGDDVDDLGKEPAVAQAIAFVGEAITKDSRWLNIAMKDPDLDAIRERKEFKAIVTRAMQLQRAVRNAQENAHASSHHVTD